MRADELFAFPDSLPFASNFLPGDVPWEWVGAISPALATFDFGRERYEGEVPSGVSLEGPLFIHPTVKLPPQCVIIGPAYIGPEVEIRPNCYVRGNVIVGRGSVLGNACEYKNCLLLENVETPHYNYVGDSVLGNRAHLGAGAICANLKLTRDEITVRGSNGRLCPTGMRKLGALMGDGSEVGCNGVLQPGTILGRGAAVLGPSFHGYLEPDTMAVSRWETTRIPRPR